MDKYKKTFRLIYSYYILIALIGIGQIFWAFRYGWEFKEPEVGGFYMIIRLLLALAVIGFLLLKMQRRLSWVVVIESSVNAFVTLYMIYYLTWHLITSVATNRFSEVFKIVRVLFVWDLALLCISSAILLFMINKWSELEIQQPAADGRRY